MFHHGQHVFDRFPDFFIGAFVTISFGIHPLVGALDGSLDDVFDFCDRIAVLKNGELVDILNSDEVTKDEVVSLIIKGTR